MDEFVPCDACGVRSYVFADLPGGLTLSYCNSHFRRYEDNLRKIAVSVEDLSYTIPV